MGLSFCSTNNSGSTFENDILALNNLLSTYYGTTIFCAHFKANLRRTCFLNWSNICSKQYTTSRVGYSNYLTSSSPLYFSNLCNVRAQIPSVLHVLQTFSFNCLLLIFQPLLLQILTGSYNTQVQQTYCSSGRHYYYWSVKKY